MVEARKHDYFLTFIGLPTTKEEKDSLRRVIGNGEFAGVLMVSQEFDDILLEEVSKRKVPCVILDKSLDEGEDFPLVAGDNWTGGKLVAEYFYKMGHRKLACITGPENTPNSTSRLTGFLETLSHYGIQVEDNHILAGDYSLDGGYHCGKKLMGEDKIRFPHR